MPRGHLESFMRSLRRWAGTGCALGLTDGQLLERFVSAREEAAFEALLRSHAPMVFRVCCRLLHNSHDAEDAFQATFLVLARKAGSISKRESVGSWLYGVAYRIAARERSRQAHRGWHVRDNAQGRCEDQGSCRDGEESWSILSEELNRLPEKYRAPLVLHYLEGKTKDETALQLGWPEGTVSGRLARGREMLRGRLVKRGVEASASAVIAAFAGRETLLAVPQTSISTVAQNAAFLASGKAAATVFSPKVLTLAEGVQRAMFFSKMKIAAVVLIATGLVAGGTAWTIASLPAGQGDEKPPPAKPEAKTAQKPPKTDLERMQGEWKPILFQSWGRRSSKEELDKSEKIYTIKSTSMVDRSRGMILEGTLKLDPATNPKSIDVMLADGFRAWRGIYEFEGDNLKICIAYGGRPRPAKISAEKEDGGDWMEILERQPMGKRVPEKEGQENKEKEARKRMNGSLFVLTQAMHRYHEENDHFPRSTIANKSGKPLLSWRVALLPYLGLEDLHKEFRLDESWDSPNNRPLLAKIPKVYTAPLGAKEVLHATYYQVFVGKHTCFEEGKDIGWQNITDGTSATILIIEAGKPVPWTKPEDLPYSADKPVPELGGAIGDGLISLTLADGSAHILRRGVDREFRDNLRTFITRDSGVFKFNGWKDLDPK